MAGYKIRLMLVFIILQQSLAILEDAAYWKKIADKELKDSLSYTWNTRKAKNVILFIGDGMSPDTITASRIYHVGENGFLAWEKFPHVGLLKTYNTNKMTPDSASTATALYTGVKTNYQVVGLDVNVNLSDCKAAANKKNHLESIFDWAQAAGKSTGFVTNTRVTHATPAPLYAHCPNRKWECEAKIPAECENQKDIARQLIEDSPGKNIKVILGGGRQVLRSNVTGKEDDPIDTWSCYRIDGRDLIVDWIQEKSDRNASYKVVENNEELANVDYENVDYLLGIFANGHISMDFQRNTGPKGQPSLEEMTVAALKILGKSESGFFLMVEGGLIDFAHHRGHAAQALRETVRFSEAIEAALKLINLEETLVIVTSDHTHSMSIVGYGDRGTSILGVAQKSVTEKIPYTNLLYSTGGQNNRAYTVVNNTVVRLDPSKENTTDFNYSQQALVITDEAYHGGGDVAVYAIGPQAHLFHSVHEQNYVANVIAYAAKVGQYKENANNSTNLEPVSLLLSITILSILLLRSGVL